MDSRNPHHVKGAEPEEAPGKAPSPWELYRGRQKKSPRDSSLVSFGERITYTFAVGNNEVASIHYDQSRGKIFYKGHNVKNADLEKWQVDLLHQFEKVLSTSEYAEQFGKGYSVALNKILHRQKTP